jgi:hypothetical protein
MGIEEGEEIQNKVIENLFNRIIAENLPTLEEDRYRKPSVCQTVRTKKRKKKNPTPDIS